MILSVVRGSTLTPILSGSGSLSRSMAMTCHRGAESAEARAVHEATKQRAVGRGVMQSVVVYEIMYHLVDDGVVDGVGCEVETGGDAQLEVSVLFTSVGQRDYL